MPADTAGRSSFCSGIIVLPTYNERENLSSIVEALWAQIPDVHILVVDDNSPDGTGEIADQLHRQYPDRLFVLHREKKEGLGRAYVAAFRYLRQHRYGYIVQMDADGSHDPSELPAMIDRLKDNDVVVGSRYLNGVRVMNWSVRRLLLSKMANRYAEFVTGVPIVDATSGFGVWRKSALDEMDLDRVFSLGYVFQVEMKFRAYRSGMRLVEVPITFHERTRGGSKMSWFIAIEACVAILRLRFADAFRVRSRVPENPRSASAVNSGR
jgi:dolichol-phosphate mannosyltransferase